MPRAGSSTWLEAPAATPSSWPRTRRATGSWPTSTGRRSPIGSGDGLTSRSTLSPQWALPWPEVPPKSASVDELATFLSRFPPFDHLSSDLLDRVVTRVARREYAVGADVLVEDGPPAEHMYVIYRGAIELRHEEEVVDILEPGESFGHASLLTG